MKIREKLQSGKVHISFEVFPPKTDAGYEYLGLYILYEAAERGEGRVELSRYDESQVQCDFLLRRDRYETEGIILDTYATREGLTEEYLEVQYPPQALDYAR